MPIFRKKRFGITIANKGFGGRFPWCWFSGTFSSRSSTCYSSHWRWITSRWRSWLAGCFRWTCLMDTLIFCRLSKTQTVCLFKHSFPPNCILFNKKSKYVTQRTYYCCTTDNQFWASIVRHSILIRQSFDCITSVRPVTVVRLWYDSRATVVRLFYLKLFILEPTTICLSHDSRTTVLRHSHDSHKTVTR